MPIPKNLDLSKLPTADPAELEVETELFEVKLGISPEEYLASYVEPRPDLAGVRCKFTHLPEIYLIMPNGFRRLIPDATTYNNLFRSWDGIWADNNINQIPEDSPLTSGSILAKGHLSTATYLVLAGQKRGIGSEAIFNKHHFDWGKIYVVPQILIDGIPDGGFIV